MKIFLSLIKIKLNIFLLVCFLLLGIGSSVLAVTDTDSLNVTLDVTSASTTDGGGGGTDPINGCMDPVAVNFNASSTVDDGSCTYLSVSVPNVTNFISNYYDTAPKRVVLTWTNPTFTDFQAVRLVRKLNSIAVSPNEGTLLYDGVNQSFTDTNVAQGATYYYSIFVRSASGDYSSGVITFEVLPGTGIDNNPPVIGCLDVLASNYNPLATVSNGSCTYATSTPPVVGCLDPEANNYDPVATISSGACTYGEDELPEEESPVDPFSQFPSTDTEDPALVNLSLGDFVFIQDGEARQFFTFGTTVVVNGKKDLTVYLPADRVPGVLKAIGVTVADPTDPNKTFSFLLRLNTERTAYTASIGSLGKDGLYPIFVYIINYKDQTIKRIVGSLKVTGVTPVNKVNPLDLLLNSLVPVSVGTGLLVGVAQTVAIASQVTSFVDLYLLILRWFGSFLGYFGFRRKNKPWGTVYDAVTKRPIDPAYVSVYRYLDPATEVSSAITDIDGRYGLFLPSDTYTLKAGKTHYAFPSKLLAGKQVDELYDNLYFGDPFITSGNEVVNLNIPLDPVGFDWNEFVKGQTEFFKVYSAREAKRVKIVQLIVWVGLIFSSISTFVSPSWSNIGILICYGLIFASRGVYNYRHRLVVVKRRDNNEPIPFAIVRAFYADINQEVKHVVTDVVGRFYMLVRPGVYYFTVEHRQPDGAYAKVYQSEPINLTKGVLSEDILI
ncbi:MAG: hypothetical protein K8Q91_02355 [Candidatus Vogelbacteria bacterium]|nr:hypothetical protein [Candidatus Vogelbacteria bacterium]